MKKFTLLLAFLTLLLYSCGAELQDQEIAGDFEVTIDAPETESASKQEVLPKTALTQAELLTEQLVNHVMTEQWLEQDYTYTEWDYHYMIVTMTKYEKTPEYPYYSYLEIIGDYEYLQIPLACVKACMRDIFNEDDWYQLSPEVFSADQSLFDEESECYSVPLQAGIHTTVFTHENVESQFDGNVVYVEFDLVNSKVYEYEEKFYGRYRFIYTWETDDGGNSSLKFGGLEKVSDDNIDIVLDNQNLKNELSEMIEEKTGFEINDDNISYRTEYNSDSRYPYIFTVNRKTDGMNFIIEFNIYTEDDVMHIGERNTDVVYYGERDEDDLLLPLDCSYPSIFRQRLADTLKKQFGDDFRIIFRGITQTDNTLSIPLQNGTDFYYIQTEIIRESSREEYRISEYDKVDLNAVTPYDFFIKYKALGLEPVWFSEYNKEFSERINTFLIQEFGEELRIDDYYYWAAEFFPSAYIILRNDETDIRARMYDCRNERFLNPAGIDEDASWDDFEWVIDNPQPRDRDSSDFVSFMPVKNYMNLLTDYLHEPYEIGDSLADSNILYLCALLCACLDESDPVYADFMYEGYGIAIYKSELEHLAACLFGNNVDLTAYHDTFSGDFDKYYVETDSYTFATGRDYWNGDNSVIDYDSLVIIENDDAVTVEVSVGHYPSMGDPADPDSFREYVYHFEKIESRGIGYLRLLRIEEIPSTEPAYTELTWNDRDYIIINDCEPSIPKELFDSPMPDFLTEDQQNLYRQAHYLFRLLMMYPDEIEDMPRMDGEDFDAAYPTMYLTVPDPDGYAVSFCPVNGRYSTWADFVSMGTAVFTDELFEKLYQKNFFRINDGTYYLNEREGSGYYYEDPAVSYSLISSTDSEIEFEAVKHIFRFPDTEDDATKTISLPVKMILTEEGWRVSMMDFEYDGELIEKDEDAYSKTMAEIYDTEKLAINYSYECEKFTIIHGIQMTGMKNGQRLWILLPDGSCSDISRKFDFNNNIRLNDFRVLYDETVLFCVDEEADRYPGSTIEYQIDIMSGEIIRKTQVIRTPLE